MNIEQRRLAEAMVEYITQAITRTQLSKELNMPISALKLKTSFSFTFFGVSRPALTFGCYDRSSRYHCYLQVYYDRRRPAYFTRDHRAGRRTSRPLYTEFAGHDPTGLSGLKLTRDWIEVNELVDTATRRLKRYKPVVEFNIQRLLQELKIYVHPALIEQALFNVLENAAKFNPEDQPIDIILSQPDTAHIQFDISDQGKGIDIADREKIFDMFYTMHGDRNPTGTGLGLAIVKAIISAHIGSIKRRLVSKIKVPIFRLFYLFIFHKIKRQ